MNLSKKDVEILFEILWAFFSSEEAKRAIMFELFTADAGYDVLNYKMSDIKDLFNRLRAEHETQTQTQD